MFHHPLENVMTHAAGVQRHNPSLRRSYDETWAEPVE